jgi:hypothetical protein
MNYASRNAPGQPDGYGARSCGALVHMLDGDWAHHECMHESMLCLPADARPEGRHGGHQHQPPRGATSPPAATPVAVRTARPVAPQRPLESEGCPCIFHPAQHGRFSSCRLRAVVTSAPRHEGEQHHVTRASSPLSHDPWSAHKDAAKASSLASELRIQPVGLLH